MIVLFWAVLDFPYSQQSHFMCGKTLFVPVENSATERGKSQIFRWHRGMQKPLLNGLVLWLGPVSYR